MQRILSILLLCVLAVTVFLATAPESAPLAPMPHGEAPPGVVPGAKLYWVQTRAPSLQSIAATTPVEVKETRGNWALVDSNGINFGGPIWLNFDQVLHYRTEL